MVTRMLLVAALVAGLAACSHGYTAERGSAGSGYSTYEGGVTTPAVMPEDRDRSR